MVNWHAGTRGDMDCHDDAKEASLNHQLSFALPYRPSHRRMAGRSLDLRCNVDSERYSHQWLTTQVKESGVLL